MYRVTNVKKCTYMYTVLYTVHSNVLIDFIQEGYEGVRVTMDVLFNLNQFSAIYRQCDVLYCSSEAFVRNNDDRIVISAADVIDVVPVPSIILVVQPCHKYSATVKSNGIYLCTIHNTILFTFQEHVAYTKPHPLKTKAMGTPIVMVPLLLYTDDTSGSRSKKWNKFDCWCFLLAGVGHKENAQL